MRLMSFVFAMALGVGAARAVEVKPLEIRFCPASFVHSYPLDTLRGVQSVIVQNVALINRSDKPITLTSIDVVLEAAGQAIDERHFAADSLVKLAKGGAALQASGMMSLAAFQFCGKDLLGAAPLSATPTLAPGAALLIAQQPFAFKGARDAVGVRASSGSLVVGQAHLPISGDAVKTELRFPLAGVWLAANGPSLHTAHRWAIPEEFALDLIKLDANGRTHRGDGTHFTDYYAYGAKITAPAAGTVVLAVKTESEDFRAMRQPSETMEVYFDRLRSDQAQRMSRGTAGILGNGVVIDHGNGEFSVLAHMKPGSVRVSAGDHVVQGQELGAVGSSGNSTEPHLHYQVCDKSDPLMCAGIPLAFTNIELPLADLPRPLQTGDTIIVK